MLIFEAEPDPYGRFGHQFYRVITALLLAEVTGNSFIPSRFKYFANNINSLLDFSKHPKASLELPALHVRFLSNSIHDIYGNDKFDFSSISLQDIIGLVTSIGLTGGATNVLVKLPFDQEPGVLLRELYLNEQYRSNLRTLWVPQCFASCYDVAIHIRRGDVNKARFPGWYIEDEFYDRLIQMIIQKSCKMLRIAVVTQGQVCLELASNESLARGSRLEIFTSADSLNHPDEIRDIRIMAMSRCIIGGLSTFSQAVSLIHSIPIIEVTRDVTRESLRPHHFSTLATLSITDIMEMNETAHEIIDKILDVAG
jgi:hypothetical protein